MESTTFETSMKVVAIAIYKCLVPEHNRKVIFIHNHEKSTSQTLTLSALKLLPRLHFLDFINISTLSHQ